LNCEPSEGDGITPARLASLMNKVAPYTRGLRTFCATGIWSDIVAMAGAKGLYLAAGCDIYTDLDYNEVELNGLIKLARAGKVDLAVVGDETLYEDAVGESRLIGYIRRVKAAGVPTTTSDSYDKLLAHPRVMAECDVIIANIYPFWEGVGIRNAVGYLDSCYQQVKRAAGGKEVIVETGWPTAGAKNGAAVPSLKNARTYLSGFMSWAKSKGVRYFYFEAYDEPWKAVNEGAVGAHWGIWDQNGRLKSGMSRCIGTR
jgi:GPH family glycoside/pentoside/hexuronide:cation symporter